MDDSRERLLNRNEMINLSILIFLAPDGDFCANSRKNLLEGCLILTAGSDASESRVPGGHILAEDLPKMYAM